MAEPPSISAPPAPTANPLVMTEGGAESSPLEGAGIVQDFGDAWFKCRTGDWTEGIVNGAIGLTGVMDVVRDPIAALAGAGIGWLIEHVSFLSEPLDWLTGDQNTLENMAGTWGNIGDEIAKVSADLDSDVQKDAAHWTGGGADAYRAFAKDRADTYAGIAVGAQAVGVLITISQTILNIIRSVVRDLIAECVGKLISMACRYPGPAVVAGMLAEGVPMAIKWSRKIIDKIKKLTKAFENGKGLFKQLGEIFEKANRALRSDGVKQALKAGRRTNNKAFDAGKEAFRDIADAVKGVPRDLQTEFYKDVGKKVGEAVGDVLSEEEIPEKQDSAADPAPQPIFEQPGVRRISGSL
jgi:hypothetical protein